MDDIFLIVISPEAVMRQLAGGIISRFMVRCQLTLEAAQLVSFSAEDAASLGSAMPAAGNLNLASDGAGLMLLLRGNAAIDAITEVQKNIEFSFGKGLTAVSASIAENKSALKAAAEIADRNNLLSDAPQNGEERTLLIIKPENFRQVSVRPGVIIDMLMSLELKFVGCKVHGMSIAEALEFYGPVRQALRNKLAAKIGARTVETLEKELDCKFSAADAGKIMETAGNAFADDQFEQIVEFMAGKRPGDVAEADYSKPAGAKCMILVFDGKNAVARIRELLGPTNPAQASGGTIRYDFGTDIMVNAAHASDSVESYLRESSIVKVEQNNFSAIAFSVAD